MQQVEGGDRTYPSMSELSSVYRLERPLSSTNDESEWFPDSEPPDCAVKCLSRPDEPLFGERFLRGNKPERRFPELSSLPRRSSTDLLRARCFTLSIAASTDARIPAPSELSSPSGEPASREWLEELVGPLPRLSLESDPRGEGSTSVAAIAIVASTPGKRGAEAAGETRKMRRG